MYASDTAMRMTVMRVSMQAPIFRCAWLMLFTIRVEMVVTSRPLMNVLT